MAPACPPSAESILASLASFYGSGQLCGLGERLGVDDATTSRIAAAALPALVIALARAAASPSGARSLLDSIARGHDEAIFDAVAAERIQLQARLARHLDIDAAPVSGIVDLLAPVVREAVERARCAHGWEAVDLAGGLGAKCVLAEDLLPGCVGAFEELLEPESDVDLPPDDDVSALGAELLRRLAER